MGGWVGWNVRDKICGSPRKMCRICTAGLRTPMSVPFWFGTDISISSSYPINNVTPSLWRRPPARARMKIPLLEWARGARVPVATIFDAASRAVASATAALDAEAEAERATHAAALAALAEMGRGLDMRAAAELRGPSGPNTSLSFQTAAAIAAGERALLLGLSSSADCGPVRQELEAAARLLGALDTAAAGAGGAAAGGRGGGGKGGPAAGAAPAEGKLDSLMAAWMQVCACACVRVCVGAACMGRGRCCARGSSAAAMARTGCCSVRRRLGGIAVCPFPMRPGLSRYRADCRLL